MMLTGVVKEQEEVAQRAQKMTPVIQYALLLSEMRTRTSTRLNRLLKVWSPDWSDRKRSSNSPCDIAGEQSDVR